MSDKKGTRIYIVTDRQTGMPMELVRARSKAAALGHVVKRSYQADVAAQEEIVSLVGGQGWTVQTAGEDDESDETGGADDVTLSPNPDE